jgi:hypothetical protein
MFRLRSTLLTLLFVGLLAFTTGVQAKQEDRQNKDKPGKPSITWSKARVVQELAPGQTATATVTLTSSVALNNVSLRVVGGLEGVVRVSPETLNLAAGTPAQVTLTMSLPADHTGSRAGVVQVRAGERNVPHSLKVKIRVPGDESGEKGEGKPAEHPGRGKGKGKGGAKP